jgi:hypothetical protein
MKPADWPPRMIAAKMRKNLVVDSSPKLTRRPPYQNVSAVAERNHKLKFYICRNLDLPARVRESERAYSTILDSIDLNEPAEASWSLEWYILSTFSSMVKLDTVLIAATASVLNLALSMNADAHLSCAPRSILILKKPDARIGGRQPKIVTSASFQYTPNASAQQEMRHTIKQAINPELEAKSIEISSPSEDRSAVSPPAVFPPAWKNPIS